MVQRISAARREVYAALLDPDAVRQWMVPDNMTSTIHHYDARPGGTFRISLTYEDDIGRGKTSERTDSFHGWFEALVPDVRVVQVVEFESDDPAMTGSMTITYELADADDGTLLTAAHEDLPAGVSAVDNEVGWRMSLRKLAALVEDRRLAP